MEKKQQLSSPSEAANWLREHDKYLILTHRRPDGDTVGCAAALCRQLRSIGKTAAVLENPQLTAHFVPYLEGLTVSAAPDGATVVAVDIASEGLLPMNGGEFAGKVKLCIDHHESNEFYAETTIVWPRAAACGELMLEILQQLGSVDVPTAEALYLAISTDCGCFCYSNTTANTLRCAATLKDLGARTYPINKLFFATKSMARMKVEALLASSLELMNGGRVGVCTLRQSDLDALGATEDDVDNIAGFARLVEGVELSVMIRDLPDGSGKVSLRSGEVYNSSAICKHLGGGGHRSAAGAEVPGGIEAARAAILAAIEAEGIQL